MPLEVRQIGIRMQVGETGDEGAAERDGEDISVLDLLEDKSDELDRAKLIQQCVEAVLAELARRPER